MFAILTKVTLLFIAALIALVAARRATAAIRHLLCVCALAGSLILPVVALFPARVIAIRLPAIEAAAASPAMARAASWSPSGVMLGLWVCGGLLLIVRLGLGHWRVARLVRAATPVRQNAIYFADVGVPIVCGLLRPEVLMPRASAEWPDWQFDAAVRHELTHARRKDLWANFIAQIACAVWWFHPLVWMIAARQRDCQETACDDAVLFSGFEPAAYAQALLAVAQTSSLLPASTLLQGCPMTTQTNMKTRIARLLDGSIVRTTSRANLLRTAAGFAILLAAIGTLGLQKSSAQSEQPYKVGGDVTQPHVLFKVDPAYTDDAGKSKIEGVVVMSVVIGTDGLAHDISVLKSLEPGLDRKAAEAVQQWRFSPGTRKGEPVSVRATIEVNFKLK